MLQKRRTIASIPDGLNATTEKIRKGSVVCRKFNSTTKKFELSLPTTADEAKAVYGFITLRIDEDTHKESYYDDIDAGVKGVVYTLVPNEEWGTTEFDGTIAVGDKLVVSFASGTKGKLVAAGSNTPQFECVRTTPALGGYEEPMIDVKVL